MKIKLDAGAIMPTRAHERDAGLDLYTSKDVKLWPESVTMVGTGVHVQIPDDCVGLITSKSGLMAKGITCRGTIDAGYTGEIKAVLYNHTQDLIQLKAGQKITQLVIIPCKFPALEVVDDLEETERGGGGFGSTGK